MQILIKFYFVSLSLLFGSIQLSCRAPKDCHRTIKIVNNSKKVIVYSVLFTASNSSQCQLSGEKVQPNNYYEDSYQRTCLEERLSDGRIFEYYIVDDSLFNKAGIFYSCDSLTIKNKILKKANLTLDELKQNNFTITYP